MALVKKLRRAGGKLARFVRARRSYKFMIKDWIHLTDLSQLARVITSARFSRNLQSIELDMPQARSAVVIAPHPDDEMIGPGGTVLKLIAAGAKVRVVYLTDNRPPERALAETRAIAAKFGYETHFLHFPLEAIPCTADSAAQLRHAIEEVAPDVVFLPFLADDHDDHRRASQLLLQAFGETAAARPFEVWTYQVYTTLLPNVVVDITDHVAAKREAISMWHSQMERRDWAHYALGLNAFNSRFMAKKSRPSYAETFFVVPLAEYLDLCRIYFQPAAGAYYLASYRSESQPRAQ